MSKDHLISSYDQLPSTWDEMYTANAEIREQYKTIIEILKNTSTDTLTKKEELSKQLFMTQGVTFTVYSDNEGIEKIFPFDIVPRIITANEWDKIEKGIKQRLKALNLFIKDIYNEQFIIKDGLIPADLIYSCPNFLREMKGVKVPYDVYVHISGVDLIRNNDGEFYVLEDNLRTPSGVSYMLENREISKRLFPGILPKSKVRSVSNYPNMLYKKLKELSDLPNPNIVLLTPGIYNSAYYEHTTLARLMGIELVEGSDLVVKNHFVYMKTTKGLKQVDVIYRRVDDDFLDPLEFNAKSVLGVAGIMAAYRKGNVNIVNAPGTGIADDKAIYIYVPDMIKYYLNEEPILKNIETYQLGKPDEFDYVVKNIKIALPNMIHFFNKNKEDSFTTLTNTISKRFTIVVLSIAFSATLFWLFYDASKALNVFTAVLIIACPCAIALSAPFTFGNLLRILGKLKFYIKNASVIEQLASINTIIFDKTGTITSNKKSTATYTGDNLSPSEEMLLKNTLRGSNHPLSRTLYDLLDDYDIIPLNHFEEHLGKGLEARYNSENIKIGSANFVGAEENTALNTMVHISTNNQYKGKFTFYNSYRKGLSKLFNQLKKDFDLVILTGDNEGEMENLKKLLPSKTKSKIKEIFFYDKKYQTAARRSSVTVTLENDVNVSRGDMIVKENELPKLEKKFTATVTWMDNDNLRAGSKYVLQHGVNKVLAKVGAIHNKINPDYSGVETGIESLKMNDIASVSFQLNKPIFLDAFKEHRTNGSFILIDPQTNNTAGVGFIE